ncbi:phosphatase PAP2 family protein [Cohnella zeiphila]|uniref:Inositol phosphorylceramide synthase n=1 Tax=Cohnella zeiphila TaxID=2761120 RepID=A0A7X0SG45_9BACL|nr:inositol phosphorylceramide synthase [Cohnella zeiphila]
MAVFHSMISVTGYTLVTVAALLWYGTGRQPLAPAYVFVRSLLASPKYLFVFVSLVAILLVNKYEMKLEELLPVHYNLTSALSGWEGSWQGALQRALRSDWLTFVSSYFYLILLQAVLVASIGIYTFYGNLRLYYAFSVAILLNYLIAVPFFLFVPVNEAWSVSPSIHFLILQTFPNFETEYRQLSGLNNCFPSLHTSISVTMALIAARSGNRRWAWFTAANAAIILFTIFYLGIHWFTDMIGGLCLAVFVSWAGLKIGDRLARSPSGAAEEKRESERKWLTATSRSTGS